MSDLPNPSRYMDARLWKKRVFSGKTPKDALLRKAYSANVEKSDHPDATENDFTFIISTDTVDRMNDTVAVDGWDTENFLKGGSGPVLFAHSYWSPPVGKSTSVKVVDGKLVGNVEFAAEVSDFAREIRDLVSFGAITSASVGFRPKLWAFNEERGGFDFLEHELLEFSMVPVPANPDAVIQARAAGIDTVEIQKWVTSALDMVGDSQVLVPREHLESVNKALGWEPSVWSLPEGEFISKAVSIEKSLLPVDNTPDPVPFDEGHDRIEQEEKNLDEEEKSLTETDGDEIFLVDASLFDNSPAEESESAAPDADLEVLFDEEAKELIGRLVEDALAPSREHFMRMTGKVIL